MWPFKSKPLEDGLHIFVFKCGYFDHEKRITAANYSIKDGALMFQAKDGSHIGVYIISGGFQLRMVK